MTEQDKIDALMENPEVKAFIQEIDGTEAEDMQAAEAKPGEPEMTILDAMKTIINRAEVRIERSNRYYDESFYRYSDSFVKENAKESGFLASQLGVTPRQAVLFTIIVEVSKGESVDAKELSQNLQANFVELLGYDGDIKALEKARLIHRGRMGGLLVPDEVQKCLRANKPYRRPSAEGLGTLEILLRMATIFHSIEERDDNVERALSEIDEMILANPATSIARTMNEYGILCHELETFNPDLVEKPRVLAITKCDMLDEELIEQMRPEVPDDIPCVFISSVAQMGLTELKDLLWRTINDERNRIPETPTQRDLDARHREQAEDNFIFGADDLDDEAPDAGGKMVDSGGKQWSEEYWESDYEDENKDFQVVSDPDEE